MLFCFVPLIFLSSTYGYQYKNIIILAGQSNMSGRGGVINETWDGFIPPQSKSNPSVLRLSAGLTWIEAEEPLHKDIDINKTCGVGPGLAFANYVLSKDPKQGPIGLVPCAIGGTSIAEWARGGFLYNQMAKRAKAAFLDGGTIRAILWYQGESDTVTKEEADRYGERLERFIDDVRSDLQLPTIPFIQVALATAMGPYIDIVRGAQLGMDLPNVQCVDAKGLALEPDQLHLSTPSQVKLGEMLGDAFVGTISSPLHSLAPTKPIPYLDFQHCFGSGPLLRILWMVLLYGLFHQ
ncbi:Sialate O-acetylesterase domain [Dillenia turbinata]|uniref:Sialate O-acetylesterase domain n=1 Tax=Dillenia turbinata TaxID=194707 RepID=A0AAN8W5Q9_9MAGN